MIEVKCDVKKRVEITELKPLQGNLKDLSDKNYAKLKGQIIDYGIIVPFFVWNKEGVLYILDGHQRHRTLMRMKQDNFDIPELPIVEVMADNFKDACKKILAISSQYGELTKQGLHEFIEENQLNRQDVYDEFNFDIIKFETFEVEYYEDQSSDDNSNKEVDLDDLTKNLNTTCPKCGFEFEAK